MSNESNMKTKRFLTGFLSGMAGGAMILLGAALVYKVMADNNQKKHFLVQQYEDFKEQAPVHPVSMNQSLPVAAPDFTMAAEKAVNAVVHVQTQFNAPNYTLYDYLFGTTPRYSTPVMSSGSGVILSPDGYIVTNNHVIAEAEVIQVILIDKRMYEARVIGKDATCDLALLKIDETELPCIPYGDSETIRVGEWVLAVGNPFNLTSTVTAGIISAKARNINIMEQNMSIESFIQTDAAVNPGNSGGALVNLNGELVGINSAIASRTGSFVGYSFAIPSNIVKKVVADFIEFGDVQRAFLGAEVADIDAALAKKLNMPKPMGVYVANAWDDDLKSNSPLKKGDVILEINSHKVNSGAELNEQLSKFRPGDMVELRFMQDGVIKTTQLTLRNKYGNTDIVEAKSVEVLGASFEPVPENEKQRLRLNNGVKVKDLQAGRLRAKGVHEGYIITRINNQAVNSVEDIEKALKSSDGAVFIEGIYPNGAIAYYAFGL